MPEGGRPGSWDAMTEGWQPSPGPCRAQHVEAIPTDGLAISPPAVRVKSPQRALSFCHVYRGPACRMLIKLSSAPNSATVYTPFYGRDMYIPLSWV